MRPARILLCQDPRRGRRALSRWRRCGIGPRGPLVECARWRTDPPRTFVAVALRSKSVSTSDFGRRRYPSGRCAGGESRKQLWRVRGRCLCVLSLARSMHEGASEPHFAGCPGSSGSFRTFLGWTQQRPLRRLSSNERPRPQCPRQDRGLSCVLTSGCGTRRTRASRRESSRGREGRTAHEGRLTITQRGGWEFNGRRDASLSIKRLGTTRLTRLTALRGLAAGGVAALTGMSLIAEEAEARQERSARSVSVRRRAARPRGSRTARRSSGGMLPAPTRASAPALTPVRLASGVRPMPTAAAAWPASTTSA